MLMSAKAAVYTYLSSRIHLNKLGVSCVGETLGDELPVFRPQTKSSLDPENREVCATILIGICISKIL